MKRYIIFLGLVFAIFTPHKTEAFNSFGGYNVWTVPCVCSAATIYYVWYAPLYLNSIIPVAGPMAVGIPPTSLWYANFDPIIPTTWSLGKYTPGVQSCWQPDNKGCDPWPVIGHVYEVGSSFPLSIP